MERKLYMEKSLSKTKIKEIIVYIKMKTKNNKMREVRIEKVVLSTGGSGDKLDKGMRLLKLISNRQPIKIKSKKRIPSLNVRPGLEVGCKITIRKNFQQLLKNLLSAINNEIKESQIENNHFSFGIHEYIEIPGTEYQRDIGILGLNVTIDFTRTGKRVAMKKIKRSAIPKKQEVTKEEIVEYMKKNFETKITTKEKRVEE